MTTMMPTPKEKRSKTFNKVSSVINIMAAQKKSKSNFLNSKSQTRQPNGDTDVKDDVHDCGDAPDCQDGSLKPKNCYLHYKVSLGQLSKVRMNASRRMSSGLYQDDGDDDDDSKFAIRKRFKKADPNAPRPKNIPSVQVRFITGPEFDNKGDFIRHSILGTLDDFVQEADRREEFEKFSIEEPSEFKIRKLEYIPNASPRRSLKPRSRLVEVNTGKSLAYWGEELEQKEKILTVLSGKVRRSKSELIMARSDRCKEINRECVNIGPDGKSNFWIYPERIGDELSGIHFSVSQRVKKVEDIVDFHGVPKTIEKEKHSTCYNRKHSKCYNRKLHCVTDTPMCPLAGGTVTINNPELFDLEIIGRGQQKVKPKVMKEKWMSFSDKWRTIFSDFDDLKKGMMRKSLKNTAWSPRKIIGPSLNVMDKIVTWNGSTSGNEDKISVNKCITFEGLTDQRVISWIKVWNNGTVAIKYWWNKLHRKNSFGSLNADRHRFYFDGGSDIILPNDMTDIPVVFKSTTPGSYSEIWRMMTEPILDANSQILIRFHGIATQQDIFKEKREEVEEYLHHNQAQTISRDVIDSLLLRMKTPQPSEPKPEVGETEADIFQKLNPNLHYRLHVVAEMKELWGQIYPRLTVNIEDLNSLCISDFKKAIFHLNVDEAEKLNYGNMLDKLVLQMSYGPILPQRKESRAVVYGLLTQAIDEVVGAAMRLGTVMKLPSSQQEKSFSPSSDHLAVPGGLLGPQSSMDMKMKRKSKAELKPEAKNRRLSMRSGMKALDNFQKAVLTVTTAKKWTGAMKTAQPAGGKRMSLAMGNMGNKKCKITSFDELMNARNEIKGVSEKYTRYKKKLYQQTYIILCDMFDEMDSLLYRK